MAGGHAGRSGGHIKSCWAPLGAPLPSLLANLAASEGSSLIHGCERRLNQPVIGGSTARRPCPPPPPPVRKADLFVLRWRRRSSLI